MKTGISLIILLVFSFHGFAQNQDQDQGGGFQMLGIAPTPYSLSKAEATTSISEGAASIFSNPALLALNKTSSIDLGYTFWIANVNNIFGGVNFKNGRRAVAFSFYTSGADDYEQRNSPSEDPDGTFSIQHISIAAALSYDFNYFSLGSAFQFLNEENYTYRANGYAFNVGIASHFLDERIRAGASVSNLGEMEELNVDATTLPANFKIGTSADIFELNAPKNTSLPILFSIYADYVHPLEETGKDYADYTASKSYFNLGLSFTIADALEISGGYKTENNARPISFGAGFNTEEITFNYALIPFNTGYGTVHSIGIQYKF